MRVGKNARSHNLDLLWANISCLLVVNMPMNGCELVGIKVAFIVEMMVVFSEATEKKHNFIQFVTIFWFFLKLGQTLTNFENMK